MRVVIVFDMEGTSHIGDFHDLYPIFPEYWNGGRQKLTHDVPASPNGRTRSPRSCPMASG